MNQITVWIHMIFRSEFQTPMRSTPWYVYSPSSTPMPPSIQCHCSGGAPTTSSTLLHPFRHRESGEGGLHAPPGEHLSPPGHVSHSIHGLGGEAPHLSASGLGAAASLLRSSPFGSFLQCCSPETGLSRSLFRLEQKRHLTQSAGFGRREQLKPAQ